jgi:DNA-binding IclR family transcriptional regulator
LGRIEAADRALRLLTLLTERGALTVTEAAREIDASVSTAHRILGTLCWRGYARQDLNRVYLIGPAALLGSASLGGASHRWTKLVTLLRPTLEHLHREINETVHTCVPKEAEIQVVDGIGRCDDQPRGSLRIGCHAPMHATSAGQAILASLPLARVRQLHADGLLPWPRATVWSLAELEEALRPVRQRGFAMSFQCFEVGAAVIGAAVVDPGGAPVAALSVAILVERYTPRLGETVGAALVKSCAEATELLQTAVATDGRRAGPPAGP